jgi:hypothetical protein
LLQTFIKGRSYFTINQRNIKEKTLTINRIAKLKNKTKQSLTRSIHQKKRQHFSKRKKHLSESYFRRYIFPKGRPLFKRTIAFNPNLAIDHQVENTIFTNLKQDLKRQEINKMLNTQWSFRSYTIPLSERSFSFGRVYLTYRRRNTFITINKIVEDYLSTKERVVFKSSCGLLEYVGPKRSTFHARVSVAKTASTYLAEQQFTSVDIIFPSGIGRVFTRLIRAMNEQQIHVRYLILTKRKAHGLSRRKKQRRL